MDASDTSSTAKPTGETIKAYMDDNFDGATLPFFYLGSSMFTGYATDAVLTVTGGNWDDRILTNAQAVISADNDPEVGTWSTPEVTYSSTNKATLTAVKTFANDSSIVITLTQSTSNPSDTYPVYGTRLSIVYREPYKQVETAWAAADLKKIQDTIKDDTTFTLPYIYLHTDKPTVTSKTGTAASTSSTTPSTTKYGVGIEFKGGTYDERCVSDAKAVLLADGWECKDVVRYENPALTAMKKTANGGYVRLTITKYSAATTGNGPLVYMWLNYDAPFTVPESTITSEQKTMVQNFLNGNTIPDFYVGEATLVDDTSTLANGYCMTIKTDTTKNDANKYPYCYTNYAITDAIVKKLENDQFDVDVDFTSQGTATTTTCNPKFKATKTFADNSVLDIDYSCTSTVQTIKLNYHEVFNMNKASDWNDENLDLFDENFDGYIPFYFSLGNSNPKYVSKTSASTSAGAKMTFVGSTWDDAIFTSTTATLDAQNALNNGTTYTYMYSYDKANGKELNIVGEFQDNEGVTHYLKATIYRYHNTDHPVLVLEYF